MYYVHTSKGTQPYFEPLVIIFCIGWQDEILKISGRFKTFLVRAQKVEFFEKC